MTGPSAGTHRAVAWPLLIGVAALAGCTAAGIGVLSLAAALTATGLPDPGPVTTIGLPFVRAAGEVAAVVAVGSFLTAAFLVPPQDNGVLDADGYRALRVGTVAAGAWAVCAALLVPLTISDVSGQPFTAHLNPASLWSLAGIINVSTAWRWTALLAGVLTVASLPVLRWPWTPLLLAGSLATLIPLGLTGHSSAGGSHDLATNSLLIHLVAASLWAGGLLALLTHLLRGGQHADLAARRFSTIALWCFGAMALSGVVNAVVRIRPSDVLSSDYGRLVIAKFVALCLLGFLGWRQRRTGVVALQADPASRTRLIRLALVEAVVFGLTFGVAVGLGRTPPPPLPIGIPSIPDVKIGYDFDGPPTPVRVLFDWRFDLIFGSAAISLGRAVRGRGASAAASRRRMADGPDRGVAAGLPGAVVRHLVRDRPIHAGDVQHAHGGAHDVVDAGSGPAGAGRTGDLALRALPAAGRAEPPGLREWLLAALHSIVSSS